jgi:hypothetical protein
MLEGPPSPKHLSRMYYELAQEGASASGERYPWPYQAKDLEHKLALAAEFSRYDPRLLGILVEYFLKNWSKIRGQKLRGFYPEMESPQSIAVIAEFARRATRETEIKYFLEYLQRGLKPVPYQWYFKNLYSPGGRLGQEAMEKSLAEYKRWGFFAREAPTVDVYHKKTVGRLDRDSRLNVLRELMGKKPALSMKDYLNALSHSISRQQALQDLNAIAKRKPGTQGRGARWVRR